MDVSPLRLKEFNNIRFTILTNKSLTSCYYADSLSLCMLVVIVKIADVSICE